METCRRKQTIARFRPAGIIPLELWDLFVSDQILWDVMNHVQFPKIFRATIKKLRRGDGATLSAGPVPRVIAGFDSLHVAGRGSEESKIGSALRALKLTITFSQSPDYPGWEQGLRLLANIGSASGWVCDLGQTSFKICARTCQMRFDRNFERLPGRTAELNKLKDKQRKLLRDWLGESMWRFFAKAGPPDAVLFAMPSRLNDEAIPHASSYIGMQGDSTLIADIISMAGIHPRYVLVVNDAELAAMEALAEERLQLCRKTLVITLGFGLGAALAMRPSIEERTHV